MKQDMEQGALLRLESFSLFLKQPKLPTLQLLREITFDIYRGDRVGLVGESGAGKSLTARSILGILDTHKFNYSGRIMAKGKIASPMQKERENQSINGRFVNLIPQEAMSAFNPVVKIGQQLVEAALLSNQYDRREAVLAAEEMLHRCGIQDPKNRMKEYPGSFSGGMLQRAMIAMALIQRPDLVIADEPTTALDVSLQARIIDLLLELSNELALGLLFVSHDLDVVSELCEDLIVMYAGEVVERASVDDILNQPRHPYTAALLGAIPDPSRRRERLTIIPGSIPPPNQLPAGCFFAERCEYATERCFASHPDIEPVESGGLVRCWRAEELQLKGYFSGDQES